MKKGIRYIILCLVTMIVIGTSVSHAEAAESNVIEEGVFLGDIDLSGLTVEEAKSKVNNYLADLKNVTITLTAVGGNTITETAGSLGVDWKQDRLIEEAAALGKQGNILTRYKELQRLKHENKVYDIELAVDESALRKEIQSKSEAFNIEAEDAHLSRANGSFVIEGGKTGEIVNVDESVKYVSNFLKNEWNGSDTQIALVIDTSKPKGDAESLAMVKDVLGTFTTKYTNSGADRCKNVSTGCSHINGTTLFPGEEFSAYNAVKPFSEENGYALAGSYLNGQVVESFGGGICQVSTTLYNAVLLSELQVVERHNHSMVVNYVPASQDAAIAESAGKDFRFINNTEYPIYIEGYTRDKTITFTIYGVETRDPGHKVSYESETIKETVPDQDTIVADSSQPVGYIKSQSVHIGIDAKLWKIVTENGKEVSREVINSSSYKPVPKTVTVGTSSADPNISAAMSQAIATKDLAYIKSVASSLSSGNAEAYAQAVEEKAAQDAAAQQAQEAAAAENAVEQ